MTDAGNIEETAVNSQPATPGSVVEPGQPAEPATTPAPVDPPAEAPQLADLPAAPETPAAVPEAVVPPDLTTPEPAPAATAPVGDETQITWTASEFVAHQKSATWYALLALAAAVVAGLIFLLTKDIISSVVVVLAAVALAVLGDRQPRQLTYQLDASGLTAGAKHYPYDGFRSFAVVPEGAFSSVVFMPLKRFSPLISIYYAPEDEPRILALLEDRLPIEDYNHDALERLMRRIRF